MADAHALRTPLTDAAVSPLRCGDAVRLSGVIYTARDSAHRRMLDALQGGGELPFDLHGQAIYYMGPSPAREGRVIGAAGPTTSSRMDAFAPALYRAGLRATIGKGQRSDAVRQAVAACRGLYLAAIGGAGALLARRVQEVAVVAYADLGPEAVRRLVVDDLPLIVAIDSAGADLYARARRGWAGPPAGEARP